MPSIQDVIRDFLAQKRIAVAGISRNHGEAANVILRKLRGQGYEVCAVNPNLDEAEGGPCYPRVSAIPQRPDAVVIVTRPEVTDEIVRECAELGVSRVWMHRSIGGGSVSESAVKFCREHDIAVIPGGCPMMSCKPVDFPHRCMRAVLKWTGRLPR